MVYLWCQRSRFQVLLHLAGCFLAVWILWCQFHFLPCRLFQAIKESLFSSWRIWQVSISRRWRHWKPLMWPEPPFHLAAITRWCRLGFRLFGQSEWGINPYQTRMLFLFGPIRCWRHFRFRHLCRPETSIYNSFRFSPRLSFLFFNGLLATLMHSELELPVWYLLNFHCSATCLSLLSMEHP